jgi:AraC-like DNA-binding protein
MPSAARHSATTRTGSSLMTGRVRREAIEDLSASLGRFYDLEVTQLEGGSYQCAIEFIAGGGTLVYRETYPRRTHIEGELLGGRFGIALPLTQGGASFLGRPVGSHDVPSALSGESFHYVMEKGFGHLIVLMDQKRLLAAAERAGLAPAALASLQPGRPTGPLRLPVASVARLRGMLTALLDDAQAGRPGPSPDAFEELVEDAVLLCLDTAPGPGAAVSPSALVRRAFEAAEAAPEAARICSLCAALRVNPRTLQLAFQAITGTGPHEFFRSRRLNRARQMLLAAGPGDTSVTAVASDLGFTELGRFAVRYRGMFGESPAESLRRHPRSAEAVPSAAGFKSTGARR